ncbi:MAG: hypothetical protein KGR22_11610 [Planctomycetes bacterium]|nr:hypothetical protein [Planctomycetota bacterium]
MTTMTSIDTTTTSDDTAEGLAALIRALPDDTDIEAWAAGRGLVVRPEGIVPRGSSWHVHDEAGVNAVDYIDVSRDPDADDYDGDWIDNVEETIVLRARWSLVVVDWDGDADKVWVHTRTVVHPTEPACEQATSHDWAVASARGDGCGTRTVEVCDACGCRRVSRTGVDVGDGDRCTSISFE